MLVQLSLAERESLNMFEFTLGGLTTQTDMCLTFPVLLSLISTYFISSPFYPPPLSLPLFMPLPSNSVPLLPPFVIRVSAERVDVNIFLVGLTM